MGSSGDVMRWGACGCARRAARTSVPWPASPIARRHEVFTRARTKGRRPAKSHGAVNTLGVGLALVEAERLAEVRAGPVGVAVLDAGVVALGWRAGVAGARGRGCGEARTDGGG